MKTLLIDADIYVYHASAAVEEAIDWGDDIWTLHSDMSRARDHLMNFVHDTVVEHEPDKLVFCFSSPDNFRKEVYPEYKSNRKKTRKPIAFSPLCAWVKEQCENNPRWAYAALPTLEADDVIGLMATEPQTKETRIIISEDKDLKQFHDPLLFYIQTIAGDAVDGYPGVPGFGMEKARALLEERVKLEPYTHVLTRGPRKGEEEVRFNKVPAETPWDTVVSVYESAGLTEDDAITQARCARILHWGEYDFDRKEVKLWEPPCASVVG